MTMALLAFILDPGLGMGLAGSSGNRADRRWADEAAAARLRENGRAVKDEFAPPIGAGDPPGYLAAVIGAPANHIVPACSGIVEPRFGSQHRDVGIAAQCQRSLGVMDAKM